MDTCTVTCAAADDAEVMLSCDTSDLDAYYPGYTTISGSIDDAEIVLFQWYMAGRTTILPCAHHLTNRVRRWANLALVTKI